MTERSSVKDNTTWMKVIICIMGSLTLLSTGWAASATTGWMLFAKSATADVARLETQGTQKAQELDKRVTVLENTVGAQIENLRRSVDGMRTDLKEHVMASHGLSKDGNTGLSMN